MDTEHLSTILHIDLSISNDIHSNDVHALQDKRRNVKWPLTSSYCRPSYLTENKLNEAFKSTIERLHRCLNEL